nr:MAG TPA: hypothetical protein [Caudoviricetes sp.]
MGPSFRRRENRGRGFRQDRQARTRAKVSNRAARAQTTRARKDANHLRLCRAQFIPAALGTTAGARSHLIILLF